MLFLLMAFFLQLLFLKKKKIKWWKKNRLTELTLSVQTLQKDHKAESAALIQDINDYVSKLKQRDTDIAELLQSEKKHIETIRQLEAAVKSAEKRSKTIATQSDEEE